MSDNNKTLNIRLSLKYDTLANWETKNPVLLVGEAAVFTIAADATNPTQATPPIVGMKVGDGTTPFNELPMLGGKSLDIYSWARAEKKPTYEAGEIQGLSDYISGEIQDTDTQYTIVKVNDYQYKLQSKAINGEFEDTGVVIDIPNDTEAIGANTEAITALQTLVGDKILTEVFEPKGEAAKVQGELNAFKETVYTITETDQLLGNKADASVVDEVKADLEAFLKDADTTTNAVDTLKEIQQYITTDGEAASDMLDAIDKNKQDIEKLNGDATVEGSVAKTVADAITALSIGDYAKAKDLTDALARVETLEKDTHTHDNKTVIDGITEEKVAAWDKVSEKADDSALAAIAKSGSTDDLVQGTKTLVLNCGDSDC